MTTAQVNVEDLQNLIGKEVNYEGGTCKVIEILEDGPALILQQRNTEIGIQCDQHDGAHRRVPQTITIPVIDEKTKELHPDFVSLNLPATS